MDDDHQPDLFPPGDDVSSDEETIRGDRDQDLIADILEEERQEDAAEPTASTGAVANRYRQLLQDQENASDSGSAEGLPRRVGSPIDSLLSVPDDSPSVQVPFPGYILLGQANKSCRALSCPLPAAVYCLQ
jgi:hypothetical protein